MTEKEEWNKAAGDYSTPHIRKVEIRTPAFLEALGDVAGEHVLDLGCGDGYYARLIAERGAHVSGVDFSQASIDLAKKQEAEKPLGITYVQGDIATMPFLADESVDTAIADMVFVTVSTQEAYINCIAEVSRVLRKGGSVLISKGHPANFNRKNNSAHYSLTYDAEPSYFDSLTPQHVTIKIDGKDVAWTNYHRTLEDFVNPWIAGGFVVTRIIEPKPAPEAVAKYPEQLGSTTKTPPYVIFSLRKE